MHNITIIWQKELRDTIRDRRTLLVMVIVPIFLMPLLFIGIGQISKSTGKQIYTVAVSGASRAPSLVASLRASHTLKVEISDDAAKAVRDSGAAVGVVIPANFEAAIRAGHSSTLKLISNQTRSASSAGADAVQSVLAQYEKRIVAVRLRQRGLSPTMLNPIQVSQQDVATKEERGGFLLSFILPIFIVIWAITGGMYTAMDISAGEKEQSTLEALLLTPATRLEITLGKLLAVATVSFLTMVAAIASMVVSLVRFPITSGTDAASLSVQLDPRIVPLIFSLGILMALAFSALELALGILARSFKEAQSYITPLYLAAFLPTVIINSIPGLQPPLILFVVPAVNAVLLFKEALLGQVTALHAAVTMIALLGFAAIAVGLTVSMFTREKVLLKT